MSGPPKDELVLVFDLGGGTLDISLLDSFEVRAVLRCCRASPVWERRSRLVRQLAKPLISDHSHVMWTPACHALLLAVVQLRLGLGTFRL